MSLMQVIANPIHPGATTLLRRMTFTAQGRRVQLIDRLIRTLDNQGIWSLLDVFYVQAAHDSAAAKLNWKGNAAYDLTAVNSPTFTVDQGFAGDGATSYLASTWAPNAGVNFTQNNAAMGFWSRTSGQQTNNAMGSGTGAGYLLKSRSTSDLLNYRLNDASTQTLGAVTDGSGLVAVERTGVNATQGYRNGVAIGAAGAATSAAPSSVALNFDRANSLFSAVQGAAIFAGASLGAAGQANLYAALQTYMTAVGA